MGWIKCPYGWVISLHICLQLPCPPVFVWIYEYKYPLYTRFMFMILIWRQNNTVLLFVSKLVIVLTWNRNLKMEKSSLGIVLCTTHCICLKAASQKKKQNILYNTGQSSNNGLRSPERSHDQGEINAVLLKHWSHLWWERLKESTGPFCKVTLYNCSHLSPHWSEPLQTVGYLLINISMGYGGWEFSTWISGSLSTGCAPILTTQPDSENLYL